MKLKYKKKNLHALTDKIALKPGLNVIADDLWAKHKDGFVVKSLLADGSLEELVEKAPEKEQKPKKKDDKSSAE
jgi:hypothetical protein